MECGRLLVVGVTLVACSASPSGNGTTFDPTTSGADTSSSSSSSSTTSNEESSTAADGSTSSGGASSSESSTTGEPTDDPGCPECIVLATGLQGGRGIAVDPTYVYFTDQTAGTLSRVPKGGGAVELLAPQLQSPYDVGIGGAWVYWTEFVANGRVVRMPSGGGSMEVFDDAADHPRALAVGGTAVYWTTFGSNTGGAWRGALSGGAPVQLLSGVAGMADIVADNDYVYVTSHDPDPMNGGGTFIEPPPPEGPAVGAIVQVPEGGDPGGSNTTILAADLAEPWGIAMSGSALFWADGDGSSSDQPNSILSMQPVGSPTTPIAAAQTAPWGVATDMTSVYWTDSTEVKMAPHGGGAPVVLATLQNNARSIAVDETSVYWITTERVLQRPKM
ncbi:MAG TPA: hypothetical protein VG755_26795 [Nannocystaceae bacterium]|nr:hypothetical protein [Nannocystaceae bacterium]